MCIVTAGRSDVRNAKRADVTHPLVTLRFEMCCSFSYVNKRACLSGSSGYENLHNFNKSSEFLFCTDLHIDFDFEFCYGHYIFTITINQCLGISLCSFMEFEFDCTLLCLVIRILKVLCETVYCFTPAFLNISTAAYC